MKHLILVFVLASRLLACENSSGVFGTSENNSAKEDSSHTIWAASERDMSITSQNSWSDLFLDSIAIENFISAEKLTASNATALRSFYNRRNLGYAWLTSDGVTEQARNLWTRTDTTKINKNSIFKITMDSLLKNDSITITTTDSAYVQSELSLTNKFIELWQNEFKSHLIVSDPLAYVPAKKEDPVKMAEAIIAQTPDSTAINDSSFLITDPRTQYNLLKEQLKKYVALVKDSNYKVTDSAQQKVLKNNATAKNTHFKKQLQLNGYSSDGDTTKNAYDSAIIKAQRSFGLATSGKISDSLVTELNTPLEQRIARILINMNRLLWIKPSTNQNLISVNIPEFKLYVYDSGKQLFEMPVIVGKEGVATNTVQFADQLNQVVFNPYWNIPSSIVINEILPAIKKDPNYLKKNNIEKNGGTDSLPQFRQLPGEKNSLGDVKFLFPNSLDIYFHDTPAKELFKNGQRALSHGCIRLADPEKMAIYLLRNNKDWTPGKIKQVMKGNEEQKVVLEKPVPVRLQYLTAWVDDNGQQHFAHDVYGLDQKAYNTMFGNSITMQQTKLPAADSLNKRKI